MKLAKGKKQKQFTTPIAFIIFNRPDLTQRVFDKIKKIKPSKLFVIADGPKNNDDKEKCSLTRKIIEKIDWDCDVFKNYSENNLGCKKRVASGIDWFFQNNNEGIILEDDCLPSSSFFYFCETLLEKYRNDSRIMHISGNNFQNGWKRDVYSYYFSYYGSVWGWATWKRAWDKYDINMIGYPEIKKNDYLFDIFGDRGEAACREIIFDRLFYKNFDTWDYQWAYARLINHGLAIIPTVNLVSNIGFRQDATHTKNFKDIKANLAINRINNSLKHPPFVIRDKLSDDRFYRNYIKNSRGKTMIAYVKKLFNKIIFNERN